MKRLYPVVRSANLNDDEMQAFLVGGQSILLVRVGGVPYAMINICPHAGSRLEHGRLTGQILKCPAHGLRFDITTGKHIGSMGCAPLTLLEVKEGNGEVVVALSA